MARRLQCPRCSTPVTVEEGEKPVCTNCGFGSSGGGAPSSPPPGSPPPGPSAGYDAPGGYGAPAYGSPAPQNNGKAIAALVLGIAGCCLIGILGGIPAIVLGFIAKKEIEQNPGRYTGKGMAVAGIVLGFISAGLTILYVILVFAVGLSATFWLDAGDCDENPDAPGCDSNPVQAKTWLPERSQETPLALHAAPWNPAAVPAIG